MMEEIKTWAPLIAVMVQLILLWVQWSLRHRFVSPKELQRERDARKALENKMLMLEDQMKNLPTSAGMHELALSMERMRGDMKGMQAQMAATEKMLNRVDDTIQRHEQIFTQAAGRGS